jgi:hypothetical protein
VYVSCALGSHGETGTPTAVPHLGRDRLRSSWWRCGPCVLCTRIALGPSTRVFDSVSSCGAVQCSHRRGGAGAHSRRRVHASDTPSLRRGQLHGHGVGRVGVEWVLKRWRAEPLTLSVSCGSGCTLTTDRHSLGCLTSCRVRGLPSPPGQRRRPPFRTF